MIIIWLLCGYFVCKDVISFHICKTRWTLCLFSVVWLQILYTQSLPVDIFRIFPSSVRKLCISSPVLMTSHTVTPYIKYSTQAENAVVACRSSCTWLNKPYLGWHYRIMIIGLQQVDLGWSVIIFKTRLQQTNLTSIKNWNGFSEQRFQMLIIPQNAKTFRCFWASHPEVLGLGMNTYEGHCSCLVMQVFLFNVYASLSLSSRLKSVDINVQLSKKLKQSKSYEGTHLSKMSTSHLPHDSSTLHVLNTWHSL